MRRKHARRLFVEALEARQLLAAGLWGAEGEDCGSETCDVAGPQVTLVDVPTKPASAVGVTFDEPVNAGSLIADGSIVDAAFLENLATGPIALGTDAFSYDAGTQTLEISLAEPLADGTYELRLDADLLADLAGNPLQGGRYGTSAARAPVMAAESLLMAGGFEIQVDSYSVPSVADWDNDGRGDLIVGEKTTSGEGKVRVYLNQGDNVAPEYQAFFYAQSENADLAVSGRSCMGVAPRVFDWDQDGRKDLVLGLSNGTVQVALNVHTDEEPLFGPLVNVQVGSVGAKTDIDVGNRATVDVVDWDNDGSYDLLLGNFDGRVLVLINQADSGPADFIDWTVVTDSAGELSVPSGRSCVAFSDLDGDGLHDLVVGNTDGQLLFYANLGSESAPSFGQYEPILAGDAPIDLEGSPRSRAFVGDVNGDGVVDILVGAEDGLVRLYAGLPAAEPEADSPTGSGSDPDEDYVHTFDVIAPAVDDVSWQCPHNRLDVNDDGYITPLDALLLINRIQLEGQGPLPSVPDSPPPYWDCSGNGDITPLDILLVFRDINTNGPRTRAAATEGGSCELSGSAPSTCGAEGEARDELMAREEGARHWTGREPASNDVRCLGLCS